jgi:hypothetical protein
MKDFDKIVEDTRKFLDEAYKKNEILPIEASLKKTQ